MDESWPDLPDWADQADLDPDVRRDLRGLSKDNAEFVGGHLIAAGTLADDDPDRAWLHARAARSRGGRIAVVRETVGLVAYRAGQWAEAITELRAARRMSGGAGHLAVIADAERALGHPDRAIELARSPEATLLDPAAAVELRIVIAGARADLGQLEPALASLQAELRDRIPEPDQVRLVYAYADLLDRAGRPADALRWFLRAADLDLDEETDAAERAAQVADKIEAEPAAHPADLEPVPEPGAPHQPPTESADQPAGSSDPVPDPPAQDRERVEDPTVRDREPPEDSPTGDSPDGDTAPAGDRPDGDTAPAGPKPLFSDRPEQP